MWAPIHNSLNEDRTWYSSKYQRNYPLRQTTVIDPWVSYTPLRQNLSVLWAHATVIIEEPFPTYNFAPCIASDRHEVYSSWRRNNLKNTSETQMIELSRGTVRKSRERRKSKGQADTKSEDEPATTSRHNEWVSKDSILLLPTSAPAWRHGKRSWAESSKAWKAWEAIWSWLPALRLSTSPPSESPTLKVVSWDVESPWTPSCSAALQPLAKNHYFWAINQGSVVRSDVNPKSLFLCQPSASFRCAVLGGILSPWWYSVVHQAEVP